MAQEFTQALTTEWVELADYITVDGDTTYYIQNRGADVLLLLEADDTPADNETDGVLVKPFEVVSFKEGDQYLYMRAYNSSCTINVSSEG